MRLDFHLARRPIAAGERVPDRIGGTSGWMAPEHQAALKAARDGKPILTFGGHDGVPLGFE